MARISTMSFSPFHRINQLIGLVLIIIAIYVAITLVTYHSGDPSLNRATSQDIKNIGGETGAVLSDLSLQILGLSSSVIVIALLAWGWRMLSEGHRIRYMALRVSSLFVGVVAAALLFAFIDAPISWPIASGLGGAMGAMLQNILIPLLPSYILWIISAILAIVTLPLAFGLKREEWRKIGGLFKRSWSVVAGAFGLAIAAFKGEGSSYINTKAAVTGGNSRNKQQQSVSRRVKKPSLLNRISISNKKDEQQSENITKQNKQAKAGNKITRKPKDDSPKQSSMELLEKQGDYEMPSLELLKKVPASAKKHKLSDSSLKQNAKILETVLEDFGVNGEIVNIRPGPVVTLYELEPSAGTKSSRVIGLADDIARSMSAISARIAVIPGRNAIGIELPNQNRETVYFREILENESFQGTNADLPLVLGKDIGGEPIIADLARMPHVLVAGTTGSGKSVAINTMIASLLYHYSPDQCKFIMVDPKMLELSVYDGIPHLLSPVVTEPGKAVVALKWAVREMENRYRLMAALGVRNIANYNKRLKEANRTGEVLKREVQTGFDPETGKPIMEDQAMDMNPLPFIVIIVDEMADLMLVAGKDIEGSIQRLAQMARAAGIHLVMATQRPSVDVITGVIKANFPTRISFQVTSKIDSRTILGEMGAEQLLGMGDMLYMAGGGRLTRVHGPFISDKEVEELVGHIKLQGSPEYVEAVTIDEEAGGELFPEEDESPADKELYDRAVAIVARDRKASTSYIQRGLRIGYNRAARLIEKMEREGVVSSANHVGKREVLTPDPNE